MHRSVKAALLSVALVATISGVSTIGAHAPAATEPSAVQRPDDRPNIVLVTTDDQTLSDMQWMPLTRRLVGRHGVTFTDALAPHPQCCPARAGIVTGQYGQNNGVQHNRGEYGGFTLLKNKANTLAAWLQDSGYQTAQMGKYMNRYGSEDGWQNGWTHWNASVDSEYSYDRTVLFNDGNPVRRTGHLTDLIRKQTQSWVAEFSATGKPFFIWASHLAPHARAGSSKAVPAARHADELGNVAAPSLKAATFNTASNQQPIFADAREGDRTRQKIQEIFTSRIRSLQAVDDMVQGLVRELHATGELDETYIFFTSDNGYQLGEHKLVGKNALYRESLAVPMMVRVPGAAASRSAVPVTLTDLAPTIADIAGVTPDRKVDGRSFAPLLHGRTVAWRDTQLVQTGTISTDGPQPGWEWRGVRSGRYTYGYSPSTKQQLLFDRSADPAELHNLVGNDRYAAVVDELRTRTHLLQSCAGDACHRAFGRVPEPRPRG